MPAAVNVIFMTRIHQSGKEKLVHLETKARRLHTENISYRNISLEPQFFIIRQIRALI